MSFRRAPIVIALPLLMAASDKRPALSPGDDAEGSLALLVSKRCERLPRLRHRPLIRSPRPAKRAKRGEG